MKEFILLALALCVFSFVYAQNENDKQDNQSDSTYHSKNILKINPLSLLFQSFNVQFEHSLKEKSSILIGLNYFHLNNVFEENLSGFCIQLAYRMYFSKKDVVPEGLFISPIIELGAITSIPNDSREAKQHTLVLSPGGRAGYQWIFQSGVALDLYFGYSYYSLDFDTYSEKIGTPVVGISFGYNF